MMEMANQSEQTVDDAVVDVDELEAGILADIQAAGDLDAGQTAGIEIDRKVLADIAVRDQAAFSTLARQARTALER